MSLGICSNMVSSSRKTNVGGTVGSAYATVNGFLSSIKRTLKVYGAAMAYLLNCKQMVRLCK